MFGMVNQVTIITVTLAYLILSPKIPWLILFQDPKHPIGWRALKKCFILGKKSLAQLMNLPDIGENLMMNLS